MVCPMEEDQLQLTQPNLNRPICNQNNIIVGLEAISWRERVDFSDYRKEIATLREEERQARILD